MKLIIQKANGQHPNWEKYKEAAKEIGIPFFELKKEEIQKYKWNNEKFLLIGGDDFLHEASKNHLLASGIFSNDLFYSFKNYKQVFQEEFLNFDGSIYSFNEIKKLNKNVFIRPNCDQKCFDGKIYHLPDEYHDLNPLHLNCPYGKNSSSSKCYCVSAPKSIEEEWRVVVVDGEIISICQYALTGKTEIKHDNIPRSAIKYSKNIIKTFQSRLPEIFIMDICKLSEKFKIVEFNLFNASNLYNCNRINVLQRIVSHMEDYE